MYVNRGMYVCMLTEVCMCVCQQRYVCVYVNRGRMYVCMSTEVCKCSAVSSMSPCLVSSRTPVAVVYRGSPLLRYLPVPGAEISLL